MSDGDRPGALAGRRPSRALTLGAVQVGGGAPVSIQSMCTTDTRDVGQTSAQILRLARAGCEIVRVAVVDQDAVAALGPIVAASPVPVVADIHFDYRLAVASVEAGVQGLRYNPGNIGSRERVLELARAAADHGVPIRVGVNSGSLGTRLMRKHGGATPAALLESALAHADMLEQAGFDQIKLSLKASDVLTTIEAYRLAAAETDYPLHLGVTEAGTLVSGTVKSSVAMGILLAEGIGDTIRVSLSADPVEEIWVARQLLGSLGLGRPGLSLTSCPRCGRCSVDVFDMADRVEERLRHLDTPLHVAVMGCEVNGPGEARAADLGVAGTAGGWVLFRRGEHVRKLSRDEVEEVLVQEALRMAEEE